VDYDYNKRGYLLPDGCKDLIDVIQPKTNRQKNFFSIRIQLPGLQSADIQIRVEANGLTMIAKRDDSEAQYERKIDVPNGFEIAKARAIYLKDQLYIIVPKAQEDFPPSFQRVLRIEKC
jgi:HSP20 family molecular chaperone IbpA